MFDESDVLLTSSGAGGASLAFLPRRAGEHNVAPQELGWEDESRGVGWRRACSMVAALCNYGGHHQGSLSLWPALH